ncbi:Vmc-like lipoprotein signal peptide domain-containing protein [Mycoplasma mycoides]|uniref:Prolipoprotein, putative phosphonate ABC transport n=1 Tax=Mycoplasma mycoides subsp. mycoides SC (strain CCUG 32753 / NCTC 10114 / PG1) TaxID=272632 RepID=Q6MUF3_MYCMS|nr:prolipoprotein, putative phosphonate ABC transport [Mycoplasma mycoides subsp. mycoides SC str. PG1]
MKKLISLMGISLLATSATVVTVACGKRDNELKIVFVPSQKQTRVESTTSSLERLLTEELKKKAAARGSKFDKRVKVTTSQSYEVAGKSLANGNEDIVFLPINTYSTYWGERTSDGNHKNLGVLLTAGRLGVKPDTTLSDFMNNSKFDNSKATSEITNKTIFNLVKNYKKVVDGVVGESKPLNGESYSKKIYDDANPVNYYRSYAFASIPFLKELKIDNNNSNSDWKGKTYNEIIETLLKNDDEKKYQELLKTLIKNPNVKIGIGKSKTSSAGFLYPILWLKEFVGLDDNEIISMLTGKDTERKFVKVSSFPEGSETVARKDAKPSDGKYAITFGFSDIRFRDGQGQNVAEEKDLFGNSMVIGATQSIYNDGIVYSRSSKSVLRDENLLKDVRQSFIDLINQNEEAKKVFSIYNQKTYIVPNNKIDDAIIKSNAKIEVLKKQFENVPW